MKSVLDILQDSAGNARVRTKSISKRLTVPAPDSDKRQSFEGLQNQAKNLLTFLKYSNKHLKDPSTPKSLQALFAAIV